MVSGFLLVLGAERHAAFPQDPDGGEIVELDAGGDGLDAVQWHDVGHQGLNCLGRVTAALPDWRRPLTTARTSSAVIGLRISRSVTISVIESLSVKQHPGLGRRRYQGIMMPSYPET